MPKSSGSYQRLFGTFVKIQTAEFPDLILFSQNQLIKMLIIMRLGVILNSDRQNSSSLDKAVIEDGALKLQLKGSAKEDSVLTMQLESEANVMQKLGYELLVC